MAEHPGDADSRPPVSSTMSLRRHIAALEAEADRIGEMYSNLSKEYSDAIVRIAVLTAALRPFAEAVRSAKEVVAVHRRECLCPGGTWQCFVWDYLEPENCEAAVKALEEEP